MLSFLISALPFKTISDGMTAVPIKYLAKAMSGKTASISKCADIFVLSGKSFTYPPAVNLTCSGISALTAVIFISFMLPSIPALICIGSAGKSFLNCIIGKAKSSGISVTNLNRSFFPMSAIILADMLPSLLICEMFQSAFACTEKYESVVFSSSPEISIFSSLAVIFPPADVISSPECSFILKSLISAFTALPQ